ncbi:MAG: response regulator [Peptostreptococcaceae bacterium]|jgi:two-component system chemotaxis response regulator CheY|nr:response regulator [Peptostreptococcaceae bacterium]
MRILIVEDEYVSRRFLYKFMKEYGECDVTVNGKEAIEAFIISLEDENPYDLILLDIMMPEIDGMKVLKTIRLMERDRGIIGHERVKIIMTTALNESENVMEAFDEGCEAYAAKPLDTKKLISVMEKLNLI